MVKSSCHNTKVLEKTLPKLVLLEDLKYVKVLKKKVKGYVVEMIQHIIFGDPNEIFETLEVNLDVYIGTSYVEKINLTIRTSLARFIRKGMNFSKTLKMHQKAFDFFQAWYKFIKPHKSLKLKINSGNKKNHSNELQQLQKE